MSCLAHSTVLHLLLARNNNNNNNNKRKPTVKAYSATTLFRQLRIVRTLHALHVLRILLQFRFYSTPRGLLFTIERSAILVDPYVKVWSIHDVALGTTAMIARLRLASDGAAYQPSRPNISAY